MGWRWQRFGESHRSRHEHHNQDHQHHYRIWPPCRRGRVQSRFWRGRFYEPRRDCSLRHAHQRNDLYSHWQHTVPKCHEWPRAASVQRSQQKILHIGSCFSQLPNRCRRRMPANGSLYIESYIATPNCDNAGIVFGPPNVLFVGCSSAAPAAFGYSRSFIYNATSGALLANVNHVSGSDQVAYSNFTKYFYASSGKNAINGTQVSTASVIDVTGKLVQSIVSDNVTAHSITVSDTDGSLVVPISAAGVRIHKYSANATASG